MTPHIILYRTACRVAAVLLIACLIERPGFSDDIVVPVELRRLIEGSDALPPLEVEGRITTELDSESKFEGRVIAFRVMGDRIRYVSFWDEHRPNDTVLPHISVACAFDGEFLRQDPWGRRDNPGSREAFAANQWRKNGTDRDAFVGLCRTCLTVNLSRLGFELSARVVMSERASMVERLSSYLTDGSWHCEVDSAADDRLHFRFTPAEAKPKGAKHQISLEFSRKTREIFRIEMLHSQRRAEHTFDTAEWAQVVKTQWQAVKAADDRSPLHFPSSIEFEEWKNGKQVKAEHLMVNSVKVVPPEQLSTDSFGWASLKMQPGRITNLSDDPMPNFQVWDGTKFLAAREEPKLLAVHEQPRPVAIEVLDPKWYTGRRVLLLVNLIFAPVVCWFLFRQLRKNGARHR